LIRIEFNMGVVWSEIALDYPLKFLIFYTIKLIFMITLLFHELFLQLNNIIFQKGIFFIHLSIGNLITGINK
jgi:hypothetical protein